MKYYFKSIINSNNREEINMLPVPFNVWEVCKYRDHIEAMLRVDGNEPVKVVLILKEKGKYGIQPAMGEFDFPAGEHEFVLEIKEALQSLNKPSPYSLDNPIRKIDKVDVLLQPEDGLCGQSCVAMLAGVSIKEVVGEMELREWQATMGMVITALDHYGIAHSDTLIITQGAACTLPKCAVLMEKMGRFCHYLICFDNKFYDSNLGIIDDYDTSKLIGYIEVYA